MKKSLLLVVLLAIVAAPAAFAENFTLTSYAINADDGIGHSNDRNLPYTFQLSQPNTSTGWFPLFDIYAVQTPQHETSDINVTFNFSAPDVSSGTVTGDTRANVEKHQEFFGLITWYSGSGSVKWDGPATVNFDNGAQLKVELQNVNFGIGADNEADVMAKISMTKAPNPVPEPGTLAMMGSGLLGLGGMIRRKFGR